MIDQTFSVRSSENGERVIVHFIVRNGKLARIFGTDDNGNEYTVGIRLTRNAAKTNNLETNTLATAENLDGSGICCCVDPNTGEMVCTQTSGPCPDCP
jgi:hypothetical protein